MKSIFNAADNTELQSRIQKLTETTPAEWGQMNAAQMMAHCQAGMNIAFGNTKAYRHWIGVLLGNIAKRRMLKADEFDRHMPAHVKLRITNNRNFEEEKEKYITLINTARTKGPTSLVKYPHPYFGRFKADEWAQLNWKHLDHHLRQFGV